MTSTYQHTLLLVDDETSILNALKRLFHRQGYHILTAESGQAALETMAGATAPISLIISDQRMPGMSGSDFLEQARQIAPEAIRFTLTGYADINAVVAAINKGKIDRYLTKPWNDEEMLNQVRSALDQLELRLENRRLKELTERQNLELARLNKDLEKKVNERTWALQIQNKQLQAVNHGLEQSLTDTIRLLVSLVEASNAVLGRYMQAVSQLAGELAADAGLDKKAQDLIEMAGWVHDIGLLGLSAELLEKDPKVMTSDEVAVYRQHPAAAALSLATVKRLQPVAEVVRMHHESIDGTGFPDRLQGDQIPIGAKILAVAADYHTIRRLWPRNVQRFLSNARRYLDADTIKAADITDEDLREQMAERIIERQAGTRYDLEIVKLLLKRTAGQRPFQGILHLPIQALKEGMILRQELRLSDGRLLMNRGSILDSRAIQSLRSIGDRELFDGTVEVAEPRQDAAEDKEAP